ncbi:MAG TPA: hypothetical protein PK635_05070 [Actinomycetota bacterium]|nr:hypothetical protein [Actinomycetota bacterium]
MATHRQLLKTLGAWSAGSMIAGGALWSAGRQTAAWGAVDAAIAAFGLSRPAPDTDRLRKVLLVNCLADVGYIGLGLWAWRSERFRADGAAVVVQGAFLLALDSHFAYHLTD